MANRILFILLVSIIIGLHGCGEVVTSSTTTTVASTTTTTTTTGSPTTTGSSPTTTTTIAASSTTTSTTTTTAASGWTIARSPSGHYLYDVDFSTASFGCTIGGDGSIETTADGGTTWTARHNGTSSERLRGVNIVNTNTLYAFGYLPAPVWSGGYKSTDSGTSWGALVDVPNSINETSFYSADIGYVVTNSGGIHKTTNG